MPQYASMSFWTVFSRIRTGNKYGSGIQHIFCIEFPVKSIKFLAAIQLLKYSVCDDNCSFLKPLSANPTKWSNTLKTIRRQKPTNCLSVFDHFAGLAFKGLNLFNKCYKTHQIEIVRSM